MGGRFANAPTASEQRSGAVLFHWRPPDTSQEAYDLQTRLYRAMGIGDRFTLFQRVNRRGRELARSGIHLRHPEYSVEQLEHAFRRMMIGDDQLFLAAWPDSPLLEP